MTKRSERYNLEDINSTEAALLHDILQTLEELPAALEDKDWTTMAARAVVGAMEELQPESCRCELVDALERLLGKEPDVTLEAYQRMRVAWQKAKGEQDRSMILTELLRMAVDHDGVDRHEAERAAAVLSGCGRYYSDALGGGGVSVGDSGLGGSDVATRDRDCDGGGADRE